MVRAVLLPLVVMVGVVLVHLVTTKTDRTRKTNFEVEMSLSTMASTMRLLHLLGLGDNVEPIHNEAGFLTMVSYVAERLNTVREPDSSLCSFLA